MTSVGVQQKRVVFSMSVGYCEKVIEEKHLKEACHIGLRRRTRGYQELQNVGSAGSTVHGVFIVRQASKCLAKIFLMKASDILS